MAPKTSSPKNSRLSVTALWVAVALAAPMALVATATDATAASKKAAAPKAATPLQRPVASISETYEPGSIVVVNRERKLYLVTARGKAITYPVAIGKKEEQWTGTLFVQSKAVNPPWTKPETGVRMPGGPGNPLGARALYLGWTLYRIHGTTDPNSIGSAASNGCFRMLNQHVIDLYPRVHIGAPVYVIETMRPAPVSAEEPVAEPETAETERDDAPEG